MKLEILKKKDTYNNNIDSENINTGDLNYKSINIPKIKNPITEMKIKHEEEKRWREEEQRRKREQKERKRKRALAMSAVMGIICFSVLGIMACREKNAAVNETVDVSPTPEVIAIPASPSIPETISTEAPVETIASSPIPSADTALTQPGNTPFPSTNDETNSRPVSEPNPYHRLPNMSVSARTDYAHFAEATIVQGNGETFYVAIDTKNKEATVDDVVMFYDDTEIQVLSKDYYYEGLTYPRVEYHCQAIKEGDFEIEIASTYDDFDSEQTGREYNVYILNVKKLNSYDGQIVYLSYYGEKYHKYSTHAGDSWQAVTLWDAVGMGIEPCGTCY